MIKLIIGYLTDNRRIYSFYQFIHFLNKIKNKDIIKLCILCNKNSLDFFKQKSKDFIDINYEIIVGNPINDCDYMDKIFKLTECAKNNNIPYIMKLDNDIIINNYIIDYMIENLDVLNDNNNLCIMPCLSSGIPTVELFINDFFNEDEKKNIYCKFKNTMFPYIWNFDYSVLNQNNNQSWNNEQFFINVQNLNYHYKGIHPIRINDNCIHYLNDVIKEKINKIMDKQNYELDINKKYPYICNSVFIIKTNIYDNIIHDKTLYVDPFDEVPVNKYYIQNKLNIVYVRNSFTIHPIYNSINNYHIYENKLFNLINDLIKLQ